MKRLIPFAVISVLLASCGGGGGGATSSQLDSGVRGQVLRGPLCPVATVDNPCPDEPYATDADLGAIELLRAALDGGFPPEALAQMLRVFYDATGRIAEWLGRD